MRDVASGGSKGAISNSVYFYALASSVDGVCFGPAQVANGRLRSGSGRIASNAQAFLANTLDKLLIRLDEGVVFGQARLPKLHEHPCLPNSFGRVFRWTPSAACAMLSNAVRAAFAAVTELVVPFDSRIHQLRASLVNASFLCAIVFNRDKPAPYKLDR